MSRTKNKRRRHTGRDVRIDTSKLPSYPVKEAPRLVEGGIYVHTIHVCDDRGILIKPDGYDSMGPEDRPLISIKGTGFQDDPKFVPGNAVGYMLLELGHGIGYGRLLD